MTQKLGPQSPVFETQMEFFGPGFSLVEPQLLRVFRGVKQLMEDLAFSLPLILHFE